MSVSTIIPLSKVGQNILSETYIDDLGKKTLAFAGINPAVASSSFRSIILTFHNRIFHAVGYRNQNGGLECYSPQLNEMLCREKRNSLRSRAVKERETLIRSLKRMRLHPRKEAAAVLEYDTVPSYSATAAEDLSLIYSITLSNPGIMFFPKKRNTRTRSCCLFVNFLDYLSYQTLLQSPGHPQMEDCDCLVMNAACNFSALLLESDAYECVHCVFPHSVFGKTMELTLRERRGKCSVDMGWLYNGYTNINDYLNDMQWKSYTSY